MKARSLVLIFALLVLSSVVFAAGNCTKEGGKNYYNVGTAVVTGVGSSTDECIGDKRLLEYYCENSVLEYEYYDCTVACSEGACTESATTPSKPTTNATPSEACVESWKCSDWSVCTNGAQIRTCEDENYCNTTKSKPVESQSCTPVAPTPATPQASGFTKYRYYIVGGIIVLLIILYFVFKEKPSTSRMPNTGNKEEQE